MSQEVLTEENIKQAMDLGFMTQLVHGGKADQKQVKSAAETGGEPEFEITYSDFTPEEAKDIFSKVANTQWPHREQVTQGYVDILTGGDKAA